MNDAAGRQRKATIADMSSGSPSRPAGAWDTIASMALSASLPDFYNKSNT